ncbi:MAG: DoxX family protein [Acidobacteriota bacterium]|nr:DoxX family protein [Acidobacteriota bacterium]
MGRFNALQPLGLLLLRLALGLIFITHGYPKLTHPGAMHGMFVQHGLPKYFVELAGLIETFGGALLIIGLFTQVAALLLAIEMGVAIWKVHLAGGYLAVHNYEFPLVVGTACFALATIGAGRISIDHTLYASRGARPRPGKGKPTN